VRLQSDEKENKSEQALQIYRSCRSGNLCKYAFNACILDVGIIIVHFIIII
jgi:hypothetical protein